STLKAHSERPSTYKKMKARQWDYVFIQGFSREFAEDSATIRTQSIPYAKLLIDSVLKTSPCAQIYFYMTWGYENGYPEQEENNTYAKMQERIYNGYMYISDSLGYPIAPTGMVWKNIRENHPEIDLYFTDRYHPNILGSYTAACTAFTAIYKESPVGGAAPKKVDSLYRQVIQQAAAKVVLNNLEAYKLNRPKTTPEIKETPILDFKMEENWLAVQFQNMNNNLGEYFWNFGDGTTSSAKNPKHYYKNPGTYTVTLHLKHNCNHFSLKKKITVSKKVKKANSQKSK
ncbi:MAG TPA: DUF4886 domain-containing protein, partial [Cytophagaceae bacterium]